MKQIASASLIKCAIVQGLTALHLACIGGHGAVAGLLLSRSTALLTTADAAGRSPLHTAATHGHARLVELLLGQGADINAADQVKHHIFIN